MSVVFNRSANRLSLRAVKCHVRLSKEKKYRTFQISGDSMLPIPDGAWVTGEFVQDWTSIKTGEACIVLTREDGLVFKIVENQLIETGHFVLSSLNPLYHPFEVRGQDIFEVWKFVHYTTDHLPEGNVSIEQLMMSVQKLIKDVEDIKKKLPHRAPFLLVDKIIHLDETKVIGIKNVTFNEYFFQGHFPDEPVMPGVLLVEALAQSGGLLVLNGVDEPEKYSTYFLKIDKLKFKHKNI